MKTKINAHLEISLATVIGGKILGVKKFYRKEDEASADYYIDMEAGCPPPLKYQKYKP